MSADDLAARAQKTLAELARDFPLRAKATIEWRSLRVTAGLAIYGKNLIVLSRLVLKDEAAMLQTLRHEYAHLLAVEREGRAAARHGRAWRQAMRDLGEEPRVRHGFEVARNETRQRVTYRCLRCAALIPRARRLPIRRRYVHAQCGGDLALLAVERVTPASSRA